MTKAPLQPQDKYVLRLPDGMRDRIKLAAEKNNRSMNAEIVAALEEKFPPLFSLDAFVEEWVKKIIATPDRTAQERMIEQAFEVIQAGNPEWYIWLSEPEEHGKPYGVSIGNSPGPLIRPSNSRQGKPSKATASDK